MRSKVALDHSVVTIEIENLLIGRYYQVKGTSTGRYLIVKSMTSTVTSLNTEAIAAAAEAI